ncbi:hypothetical protein DIURU_002380 [Diutina rugosa]|uniref:HlyIII-domain-containing protein n=1 Tax=Diutina rugosa TaxID=5481 RepID=A0A642UQR5_DIURU|nr:uncharacterized protein DIURU_002380 [Diutina rugosa]KAA8903494.1 hypothetical protein DIURU_002380 [Diutina rugosa]
MSARQRRPVPVATTTVDTETPATTNKRTLHFFHQLEPWQQDNHYIKSGYVPSTNSYWGCAKSLLYIHNETGNIYSHLIPGSTAFLAVCAYLKWGLPRYPTYSGWWEEATFLMFGAACWGCLFMSSTFHCLKAHSHKVSKFGNQLDYFGIVILITCSLISIMNFSYRPEPTVRNGFNFVFLVFGSICTYLTLHPEFSTPKYRPFRSFMFIIFGLSGVLPILCGIYWYGGSVAWERAQIKWLLLEGAFYIAGALLYAGRIPERFTHTDDPHVKGKFDIWGHSHQIFHVMVVIAAWCHWKALVGCYNYMHQVLLASP